MSNGVNGTIESGGSLIGSPPTDIDPELVEAMEDYLDELRQDMLKRLRKGEIEYSGLWKDKTLNELVTDINEEESDRHVYTAMLRYKTKLIRNRIRAEEF